MIFPSLSLLLFATAASAISCSFPGTGHNWTNVDSQTIRWSSVDTDPQNFTAVLVNQNTALMPGGPQILKALVVTSLGNTQVSPPSEGWPAPGAGYRVNLCKSSEELNTILAQSTEFSIVSPPVSSSATPTFVNTATAAAAPVVTSTTDSATLSSASATPAATSGGFTIAAARSGVLGFAVIIGALLTQL